GRVGEGGHGLQAGGGALDPCDGKVARGLHGRVVHGDRRGARAGEGVVVRDRGRDGVRRTLLEGAAPEGERPRPEVEAHRGAGGASRELMVTESVDHAPGSVKVPVAVATWPSAMGSPRAVTCGATPSTKSRPAIWIGMPPTVTVPQPGRPVASGV